MLVQSGCTCSMFIPMEIAHWLTFVEIQTYNLLVSSLDLQSLWHTTVWGPWYIVALEMLGPPGQICVNTFKSSLWIKSPTFPMHSYTEPSKQVQCWLNMNSWPVWSAIRGKCNNSFPLLFLSVTAGIQLHLLGFTLLSTSYHLSMSSITR